MVDFPNISRPFQHSFSEKRVQLAIVEDKQGSTRRA